VRGNLVFPTGKYVKEFLPTLRKEKVLSKLQECVLIYFLYLFILFEVRLLQNFELF